MVRPVREGAGAPLRDGGGSARNALSGAVGRTFAVRGSPGRAAAAAALLGLSACSLVGYPGGAPEPTALPAPVAPSPAVAVPSPGPEPRTRPAEPVVYADPALSHPADRPYRIRGRRYRPLATAEGYAAEGLASWYGDAFAGRPTSSGVIFDPDLPTAAHRTLPMGSWVVVTNLENGRRVRVQVLDRGPFADPDRRIVDLSRAAAEELRMVSAGVVRVRVEAEPGGGG